MVEPYVPDVGHLVWLSLDPQRGREQAGRRPFLVLTPSSYNGKTSLAVGAPVTSRRKNYPFEVPLVAGSPIAGVVLVDQVKSVDWQARFADFAGDVSAATLRRVRKQLATFLQLA